LVGTLCATVESAVVRAREETMPKPPEKPTLKLPSKLVFTTLCAAIACHGGPEEPDTDASVDASTSDAMQDAPADAPCVYHFCNGPTNSPSCPGLTCLPANADCPSGCEPFV
jgi:hypothetical protein